MLAWFDLLTPVPQVELKIYCAAEGWFTEQLKKRSLRYEILPMPRALSEIRHGQWKNRVKTLVSVVSMAGSLLKTWTRIVFDQSDVVILTGGRDFIMLFPLVLRLRRHTVTLPQTTDWAEIPTCKWMCRIAARTYAISDEVAESIAQMGIPRRKIAVHPLIYTVDHGRAYPSRSDIRRELGISAEGPLLGMTGVIRPHKGQREAVLVVQKVLQRIPQAKLVIVGAPAAGTTQAEEYYRGLRDLIRSQGLEKHVTLLGWRDDVPRVMRAMDLLLVPSHDFEGVPRVILEGLEAGLPIAASDLPQFKEILGRHGVGILHPIDDLERWSDSISELLSNRDRWEESSAKSRSVWERHYSFASVQPRLVAAFLSAAADDSAHQPSLFHQEPNRLDPTPAASKL